MMIEWERKTFLRLSIGMWLACLFSGIFFGILLAPYLQAMFGVGQSGSPWEAPTAARITFLILQAASVALLFSGFLKLHLVRAAA
jgi:heme/copper-type cytochrome/quinol oxidase subunit 3